MDGSWWQDEAVWGGFCQGKLGTIETALETFVVSKLFRFEVGLD